MPANYSLSGIVKYFLRLGAIGFGGPAALVGYMHRDLVETRGWIKDHDYKEGLLGWLYSHFGGLPWMQVVFYGVGAAIIGLLLKLI